MVNRGSEVYAHEVDGTRSLLWAREASSEEDAALDHAADTVRDRLAKDYEIEIDIVRNRLNRRKLDLIPTPEWADPPKARIGELLAAVDARLRAVPGGIAAVIDMTADAAKAAGLRDPRITTDVKHVEVGLTDKSDSIAYVMRRLAPVRAILPAEVLLAGDEFGPIGGFEGSDYRMVSRLAAGATIVCRTRAKRGSAGRRPPGRRPGGLCRAARRAGRPRPGPGPRAARAGGGAFRTAAPARRVGGRADGLRHGDRGLLRDAVRTLERVPGHPRDDGRGRPGSAPGAYVAGLFDGTTAGQEDLVVIADWAATEITVGGGRCAPGSGTSSSTPAGSICARSGSSARSAVSTPTAAPAAQVGADREPRRPAHRRRPAGARRRGRPRGEVQVVAALRTHEAHGPLPHVEIVATGSDRRGRGPPHPPPPPARRGAASRSTRPRR